MIGPRNTAVRSLMDEFVHDQSPFIMLSYWDTPELWVDRLYEGYYEGEFEPHED